jgi:hypothetical protein
LGSGGYHGTGCDIKTGTFVILVLRMPCRSGSSPIVADRLRKRLRDLAQQLPPLQMFPIGILSSTGGRSQRRSRSGGGIRLRFLRPLHTLTLPQMIKISSVLLLGYGVCRLTPSRGQIAFSKNSLAEMTHPFRFRDYRRLVDHRMETVDFRVRRFLPYSP